MNAWAPTLSHRSAWPRSDRGDGSTFQDIYDPWRPLLDIYAQEQPTWLEPLVLRMVALLDLEDDWDSYGAARVDASNIEDALNFLFPVMTDDTMLPSVSPMSSGGIGLSWRRDDVEVEMAFDRARESEIVVTVGQSEWAAPLREGQSLFRNVIDRLHN